MIRSSASILSFVFGVLLAAGCARCEDSAELNEDWCLDPNFRSSLVVHVDVSGTFSHYFGMDSVFQTRAASDDAEINWGDNTPIN